MATIISTNTTDLSNLEAIAKECTALMDAIDHEGLHGNSTDPAGDPRFTRISEIVTVLEVFAPHLLDPRFRYGE